MLRNIWTDFIALILRRPSRYQVAALCWRRAATGLEVLLISSRHSGRWILPKGWPQLGQDSAGTALQEAWEEAGIRFDGTPTGPIGSYSYRKRLDGDVPVRTEVEIFAIEVTELRDDFPEAGQRKREWFSPEAAAALVQEPGLAQILRDAPKLIAH